MDIFYKYLFTILVFISSLQALEQRIIDKSHSLSVNETKSLNLLFINELEKDNNKILVYLSSKIEESNVKDLKNELLDSFGNKGENITFFFINKEKSQIWFEPDNALIDNSMKMNIIKNLQNNQIYNAIFLGAKEISQSFIDKSIQNQKQSDKSLFQYFDPHFLAFLLTLVVLVIVQSKMERDKKE